MAAATSELKTVSVIPLNDVNYATILDITRWVCTVCRTDTCLKFRAVQSGQTKLAEEFARLRTDFDQLKSDFEHYRDLHPANTPPVKWPLHVDAKVTHKVVAAVHMDLTEKQRRARVVVNGLSPVDDANDADLVLQLCENYMPIKPVIKSCRRLGKSRPGNVQSLLV